MNLCDKLKDLAQHFYNWFKPAEIVKPDCVLHLLQTLYPTVNWDNVHFYSGLPWYIPSSEATAITLPGLYDIRQIHIYFDRNFDPCSCKGLGTIVHEAFHVQQYTDSGTGGLGFIRKFMIMYLACTFMNGYKNNPMETGAYSQENTFNDCCEIVKGNICDCSKEPPAFDQNSLNNLITACPNLVIQSSGFIYNCSDAYLWLGALIDLLLAFLLPAAELVLLTAEAVLLIVAGIVCAITGFWNFLAGVLHSLCRWSVTWEKKCRLWSEERIRKCAEYRDDGVRACAEYRDQGYEGCERYQDQGYSECSAKEDQGYSECCDWWPCSWCCDALVWFENIVCVAWCWIVHLVCVAWYWIANLVCVAWYWISSFVCILWAVFVNLVCAAFTWIIKTITCW